MLSMKDITVQNESNVTDERTFLQRIRRIGLYRIIRANGHDISEDMSAQKLRNYIAAYEDEIDFSKVKMWKDKNGQINVSRPEFLKTEEQKNQENETIVKKTVFNSEEQKDLKDWDNMTYAELRRHAVNLGVNTYKMKKGQILEAIKEKAA